MEIIDFINPFSEKIDSITSLFVFIIFLVFFGSVFYMIIRQIKFNKFFKRTPQTIVNDKKLENLIIDFEHGLIDINGSKKSLKSFNKKVDQEAIINLFYNDKILNSISSTLVGLGILGTFSGLAVGVSGFQMDSTETIKNSIGALLGGMGTAFVTSIHGMFWSLIFTLFYQFIKHKVLKQIDLFYSAMDKHYLATEIEIEEYQNIQHKQNIKSVIHEYFVNQEDGVELSPRFYFKELLDNSRNQTNLLSTFATEIREQLEEVIEQVLENANANFKDIIESKLVPVLEELRNEKKDGEQEVIKGIIKQLEISMKEMLVEFKDSITGDTKGEMEGLAQKLSIAAEALGSLPNDIKGISNSLKDDISNISDSVSQVMGKMFSDQEQTLEKRREIEQKSNEELSEILNSISSGLKSQLNQQELSSDKFKDLIFEMNTMTVENKKIIDSFTGMIRESRHIFKKLENSTSSMETVSTYLNIGSESIKDNANKLNESVSSFVTENSATIDKIQRLQNDIQENTNSFLSQFEKMEGGIQNVFGQFNKGLESYTTNLNNTLSSSLGSFVDKTKDSIEALNSLTTELNDGIEYLSETINKSK